MDADLIALRIKVTGGKSGAAEVKALNKEVAASGAAAKSAASQQAAANARLAKTATTLRSTGRALTTYATLPIVGVGVAAGVMALDFDRSMRNVNSIAQLPEKRFESLKHQVLELAGPTAQAPKTLAEGMYDLVSSGFNAAESVTVLKRSALAASAGLTTTEVSTKAVAASLNAYHLPAKKAGQVSDTLFETVNRGVLTFDELASTIGDTLPFAAQLHVNLGEVGSALSTMTKQGLSSAEAVTRTKNTLVTLIKPGEDLSKALKEIGMSGEELVAKQGLQGALETIVGTTKGNKDEIAALFPNIRALGGVLSLVGQNAKFANEDLAAFKTTTGATNKVLKEQEKSFGFQLQRGWAELQAVLIELGEDLLPIVIPFVIELAEAARSAVSWFAELPPPLQKAGLALAGIVALAGPFMMMTGSILQMGVALSTLGAGGALAGAGVGVGALGGVALVLGAEVAAFMILYNKVKWFRDATDVIWKVAGNQMLFLLSPIALLIRHFDMLKGSAGRVVNAVVGFFGSLPSRVMTGLRALPHLMGLMVGRLIGLWLTLPFRIPALIVQMRTRVISLVSSLAPKLAALGLRAITALARGIVSGAPAVYRFFSALPGKIEASIHAAAGRLFSLGRSIASQIASGLAQGLMDTLPGPVKDALGKVGGVAGDVGGFIGGIVPGNAEGTTYWQGGLTLVGERGPELVSLPRASQVVPAAPTRRLLAPFDRSPKPAALAERIRSGKGRSRVLVPVVLKVGKKVLAEANVEAEEDARARL